MYYLVEVKKSVRICASCVNPHHKSVLLHNELKKENIRFIDALEKVIKEKDEHTDGYYCVPSASTNEYDIYSVTTIKGGYIYSDYRDFKKLYKYEILFYGSNANDILQLELNKEIIEYTN